MYKTSYYNCFVPYKEGVLYFNTVTQASFVLSRQEHLNIQKQFEDPISFDFDFPSVFQQFKDWGFIVEDGLDEISGIRYDYMNEVINNHNYCLSILVEKFVGDCFVGSLNNHLNHMFEQEELASLTLEWIFSEACNTIPIEAIDQICLKARNLCEEFSVKFGCKIRMNNLLIPKAYLKIIHEFKIGKIGFSINLQDQGRSTGDASENMKNISNNLSMLLISSFVCDVSLEVIYRDKCTVDLLDNVLSRIDENLRPFIGVSVICENHSPGIKENERNLIAKIEQLGFNGNVSDTTPKYLRAFQNTITTYGNVRLWPQSCDLDNCGKLNEDGKIVWNKTKRNCLLGRVWFDNTICSKCKYLPILLSSCSQLIRYDGNRIEIACPLVAKSVRPESILVQIYEAK